MTTPAIDILPPEPVSRVLVAESTSEGNWMLLVPKGRSQGRDGRGPYDAGGPAEMRRIIERTKARLGATELMVDYDHQACFAAVPGVGGNAKASGWVKEFRVTNGGIEGRVEWTAAGRAAIRGREYRYLSPVFNHDQRGNILSLHSVGLVNTPNFDLEAVAASAQLTPKGKSMEKIAKTLGLPADANEEAIVAAIGKLKTGSADPANFVPMSVFQDMQAEFNKMRSGITEADAQREVDYQVSMGRIFPAAREWAVNLCQSNKAAYDDFLGQIAPAVVGKDGMFVPQLGHDRLPPSAHSQRRSGAPSVEDEIYSNLGLSAEDVKTYGRS